MKHIIIGTAGHVDHGKTALVKALTGTDTDRLPEEKKRGVTIDLGFAHLPLDENTDAGIIDVPGHEKFIRNMLTGAGQVDLALLVIAADEGIKPQTIEHLEILQLLGIQYGVIAVTRCDLADAQQLAATREALAAWVAGTFLAHSPVVNTCSVTGMGVAELRGALLHQAVLVPPREASGPFRMPVDRVFTLAGFGTIATGVLTQGTLKIGDTVVLSPGKKTARVRGLQCYGQPVDAATAGQRTAVNLAGVARAELCRGGVLEPENTVEAKSVLNVKLNCLPDKKTAIQHASRVHVHLGCGEALCRVYLGERRVLAGGAECCAQLVPMAPLAAAPGDRFVMRFYSPVQTIGGGVVLGTAERRYKPSDVAAWRRLATAGTSVGAEFDPFAEAGPASPVQSAAKTGKPLDFTQDNDWKQEMLALLEERNYLPLKQEEAAERMGITLRNCARILDLLSGEGLVCELGRIGWLGQAHWVKAENTLRAVLASEPFTLAQYRDLLGASRKPCQVLLEYFDSIGFTMRVGEARIRGPRFK